MASDFFLEAKPLVEAFDRYVNERGLGLVALPDHICYKCSTVEEYEKIRSLLETESIFVYQSWIAGRRISVVKLKEPISSAMGSIHYLELSDQKPDGSQKSGFHHIEIYPTSVSYQELIDKIGSGQEVVRPHHTTWDISIGQDFFLRLENEPLIDKIKKEEMV